VVVNNHCSGFQVILLVLLVLLAAGLAGCATETSPRAGSAGVGPQEILIGNSSALAGHASFLGSQYLQGHQALLEEVNDQGGIHGRRIKILAYDDGYDPPRTEANTRKLIEEDKVFMLLGYVGTPTSVRVIDIIHDAGIPAFGFFTGAEALRTPFRPYMFHVRASYYGEAEAAIAYFVDHLGLERISVVYQDDAFGYAVLRGVHHALRRRGIELESTSPITRGSMVVEPAVEAIAESGAQGVVMVGTYAPLGRFIRQCHELGYSPYFDTVSFVGSEAFARELVEVNQVDPSRYEQIIVTQVVPSPRAEGIEIAREFRETFSKRFPDDPLNYVAFEGFINAKILVEALVGAGARPTRESLLVALESLAELDVGVGEPITYGSTDRKGLNRVYLSRLSQDGTFETFVP
jgi:ABC-type branched-subunit amino acid transport system substrate-binding protein